MKFESPERLIAKYLKSATNGRVITVRLRRLLTIIVIPVIVSGLIISYGKFKESIEAFQDGKKVSELLAFREKRQKDLLRKFDSTYTPDRENYLLTQKQMLEEAKENPRNPNDKDFFEMIGSQPIEKSELSVEVRLRYVQAELNELIFDKKQIETLDDIIYNLTKEEHEANRKKYSFLFFFAFFGALIIFPWLFLRTLYWIIDADKTTNDI